MSCSRGNQEPEAAGVAKLHRARGAIHRPVWAARATQSPVRAWKCAAKLLEAAQLEIIILDPFASIGASVLDPGCAPLRRTNAFLLSQDNVYRPCSWLHEDRLLLSLRLYTVSRCSPPRHVHSFPALGSTAS